MFNIETEDSMRRIDADMKMMCIMKLQIPSYMFYAGKSMKLPLDYKGLEDKRALLRCSQSLVFFLQAHGNFGLITMRLAERKDFYSGKETSKAL